MSIMFRNSSKLEGIKIFKKIYTLIFSQLRNLTVQPKSHWLNDIWHYKSQEIFCNMSVSHTKNFCESQNSKKYFFFLYFQLSNNVFLLVSPEVLGKYWKFLQCSGLLTFMKKTQELTKPSWRKHKNWQNTKTDKTLKLTKHKNGQNTKTHKTQKLTKH